MAHKPLADVRQVQKLADCIESSGFVKEIRILCDSGLNAEGLSILGCAIQNHKGIRVLDFQTPLGDRGAEILASNIPPRFTTFRASNCGIQEQGAKALMKTLEEHPKIAHLNLSQNPLWHAEIIASDLPLNLTTIRLSDCRFGGEGVKILMQAIRHHSTIVHVDLSYNRLQDALLSDTSSFPPSMVSLNLSGCGFTDVGIGSLAAALSSTAPVKLCELDLSGNDFGSAGAKAIANIIPSVPLEKLDLSENTIDSEGARDIGCVLAEKACRLLSLEMRDCAIGDDGIRAIAQACRVNVDLQSLDFNGNPFSHDGLVPLRDALYDSNRTLREIDVGSCASNESSLSAETKVHEQVQFLARLNESAGRDLLDEGNRPVFEWLREHAKSETDWDFVFDCLDKRRVRE